MFRKRLLMWRLFKGSYTILHYQSSSSLFALCFGIDFGKEIEDIWNILNVDLKKSFCLR